MTRMHYPRIPIEDVGDGPFLDDKEVFLCSIAISLKRIADELQAATPAARTPAERK